MRPTQSMICTLGLLYAVLESYLDCKFLLSDFANTDQPPMASLRGPPQYLELSISVVDKSYKLLVFPRIPGQSKTRRVALGGNRRI